VERFHGELQRRWHDERVLVPGRASVAGPVRWEHNHVRPPRALKMQTPASRWHRVRGAMSEPAALGISGRARVLKVDSQGKLTLAGKNWSISDALAGEWVQVLQLDQRLRCNYCTTLIREMIWESSARPWSSLDSPALAPKAKV